MNIDAIEGLLKEQFEDKSDASFINEKGFVNYEIEVFVDDWVAKKEELKAAMDALKPLQDEVKRIETQLVDHVNGEVSGDTKTVVKGNQYEIHFGQKAKQVIDMDKPAIKEILGDKYDELVTIPITKLRNYLSPEEQEDVLQEERVGRRAMKAYPI